MGVTSLNSIAAGSTFRGDAQLTKLLIEADQLEGAAFGVVDFSRQAVAHAGSAFERWTGISVAELLEGGIRKIVTTVQPEQLQHLALIQAAFVQKARSADFDPREVSYLDLNWSSMTPNGIFPLVSTMVALTFTATRDLGWTVCFQVKDDEDSVAILLNCKKLLRAIKERHNEVYPHPPSEIPEGPSTIQTTNPILEKITPRELEVLALIGKGYSTPDIAAHLSIAANTVESHRKKLLEKFDAKNVAELVKKASKVYWLE